MHGGRERGNDLQMLFVESEHLNDVIVSMSHSCSSI